MLNQPKGLFVLCFSEMWERFGNMTILTLMVLYLTKQLHYADHYAYLLSGAFSAFLYITPAVGGSLASRILGFQRAILIGGGLLAIGYFTIATTTQFAFFVGLSLLILGNGFFKPNVSSIVGELYAAGDSRRESGFTLFYMGINLGNLLPPIFIGKLVNAYGWHSGFVLAGVGMLISLAIFLSGRRYLDGVGEVPKHSILNQSPVERARFNLLFVLGIIISVFAVFGALKVPQLSNVILLICSVLIICYIVLTTFSLEKSERNGMLVCLILTVISVAFWAIYMQVFSSLLLFADRNMSMQFLGMTINAEMTPGFESFFVLVFAPVLSLLWPYLAKRGLNPSYSMKFAVSILGIALAQFVLAFGIKFFSHNGLTSPWWIVLTYFMLAVMELVLSPIGLAMVTALTPKKYIGLMMGVWFLALAAAFSVGGLLATIASVPPNSSVLASQDIYMHAFFKFGCIGLFFGLIALALVPKLKKMVPA
ncbi:MAG: dtpA 1 [Gammaproteobacteria bacterium]|jgi:POT family proton-dependent oligopeptide transporter|nr:dtpA 1 [Gammaproteobacteria bacterium]